MSTEKRQRQKAGRQARLAVEQRAAKRRQSVRRGITLLIVVILVVGLSYLIFKPGKSNPTASTSTTLSAAAAATAKAQATADKVSAVAGCPSNPKAKLPDPSWKTAPPMTVDTSKSYTVTIKTDVGTIVAQLDAKTAPVAVNDFVFLAEKKFYNCVTFHRVIPQFMDQTGDPTGTGTGGVGYTVPGEVPATATPQYPIGSLAMAKTSAAPAGTSSNQFFIVAGATGESLPADYALFGHVTSGQSVVDKINADGDSTDDGTPPKVIHRMLSVTVTVS